MQEKMLLPEKKTRRHTTKEEREWHIGSWKKSGLSMSEYCRQHDLSPANLSDWKRSLLLKEVKFKAIEILPSTLDEKTKIGNRIEMTVGEGIKIRLEQVVDAKIVIEIVKGLLSCS